MPRRDFHLVPTTNRWHLQNAAGLTLGTFTSLEKALHDAFSHAEIFQSKGFAARVTVHHPGEDPEVLDFEAMPGAGKER